MLRDREFFVHGLEPGLGAFGLLVQRVSIPFLRSPIVLQFIPEEKEGRGDARKLALRTFLMYPHLLRMLQRFRLIILPHLILLLRNPLLLRGHPGLLLQHPFPLFIHRILFSRPFVRLPLILQHLRRARAARWRRHLCKVITYRKSRAGAKGREAAASGLGQRLELGRRLGLRGGRVARPAAAILDRRRGG